MPDLTGRVTIVTGLGFRVIHRPELIGYGC